MNFIILEGVALYLFLVITALLFVISILCLICTMLTNKKELFIKEILFKEQEKVRNLTKENFVLRLKCGEFDIDDM